MSGLGPNFLLSSAHVDGSSCVGAVAHRNFYSEVEHSMCLTILFFYFSKPKI